jgi:membrane protein
VFDVNQTFVALWPFIRHVLAVACALASIELLYYLGPDRKHTLREQLPGSVFAVVVWIASTLGLGIYLSDFGNLNAMYGTLASFIVLMIWLQISAMAILLGAALNAELARAKQARAGVARSQ